MPFIKVLFVNDFNVRMDIAMKMKYTSILEMDLVKYDSLAMLENIDGLWDEFKPFYYSLHNFALLRLKLIYPTLFEDNDKYIPAHLFGNNNKNIFIVQNNIFGFSGKNYDSDWMGIYDLLQLYETNNVDTFNLTNLLFDHEYNKSHVFLMADLYFQSFGFDTIIGVDGKRSISYFPNTFKFNNQVYNILDGAINNEKDIYEAFELWMSLCYKLERQIQTVTFRNPPNQGTYNKINIQI